jgi:hypothetical protein
MFKKNAIESKQTASVAAQPAKRAVSEPRPAPAPSAEVTQDAIAKLAFQKWQKRGCPSGEDQRDWFDAERELKSSQAGRARRG